MRKAYIQPEVEVISLSSLNDFLMGTNASLPEVEVTQPGGGNDNEWI